MDNSTQELYKLSMYYLRLGYSEEDADLKARSCIVMNYTPSIKRKEREELSASY